MKNRHLSRMVWLSGLLIVLTACTDVPSLHINPTPQVKTSTPPPTATIVPEPSPTPFGGASAQLGPLSQTCPLSSIRRPKTISPQFAAAVGDGPAWGVGFVSDKQVPLALVWSPNDASKTHTQYGWAHKLLWAVATQVREAVTIHGMNLQTETPLYPEAEYAEAASTPTALILNPSDPTVASQDANRDDHWTQFPGGLTVPGAGCYSLEAVWPGGSWQITFAAGLISSSS